VTRIAFTVFTFLNLVYSIRGFVMNFVTKFLSVLGLTVALSTNAVAAVVLVTDSNGILTGANGVSVNSILYDVTFGDGIYANSITAFDTQASARQASAALDSVFQGIYDTSPQLTNGCSDLLVCTIYIPFRVTPDLVFSWRWHNDNQFFDIAPELSADGVVGSSLDMSRRTISFWRLSTPITAVPEPESYAMFLAGLGLLGFVSRRRKQKAAV